MADLSPLANGSPIAEAIAIHILLTVIPPSTTALFLHASQLFYGQFLTQKGHAATTRGHDSPLQQSATICSKCLFIATVLFPQHCDVTQPWQNCLRQLPTLL
jgi:hypothetical protein